MIPFPADGGMRLAAAYLDERAASGPSTPWTSTPGDSDEPGSRRIALATYDDYVAYVDRLPTYLDDGTGDLEARIREVEGAESKAREVGRQLSAQARHARARG